MPTTVKSNRWSQIVAWAAASLFILGFFFSQVGAWTGPILGVWFVGTQKPRRGFLWMMAFAFVPSLIFGWRKFPLTGPEQALEYLAGRCSPPCSAFCHSPSIAWSVRVCLDSSPLFPCRWRLWRFPRSPCAAHRRSFHDRTIHLPHLLVCGDGRLVVEPGIPRHRIFVFGAGFIVVAGFGLFRHFSGVALPINLLAGVTFSWICLGAALFLSVWALFHPLKHKSWAERPGDCRPAAKPLYRRTFARGQRQGP